MLLQSMVLSKVVNNLKVINYFLIILILSRPIVFLSLPFLIYTYIINTNILFMLMKVVNVVVFTKGIQSQELPTSIPQ